MTDKDVIEALECCLNNDWNKTKCAECLFYNGGGGCIDELKKAAIDLINRQQAEIERLKNELAISQTGYVSMEGKAWELREQLKTAKAEAVKEFAERLKGKIDCDVHTSEGFYFMVVNAIDILEKEMIGE